MSAPLFRRLLGPAIETLPPVLRAVHDAEADLTLQGTAEVRVNPHPLARWLCRMMRLPAAGTQIPTTVAFSRRPEEEHWRRHFGKRSYASRLAARQGLLIEHMGPATNIFRLSVVDGALHLDLIGFRFLGIPLPSLLRPACHAVEREEDGLFTFSIVVRLHGLGEVIHYSGRLAATDSSVA